MSLFEQWGPRAFGVFLIVLVACIWVAAGQLIESILDNMNFNKPFFLTYFNTCGFSFWLLGGFCVPAWRADLRRARTSPLPSPLQASQSPQAQHRRGKGPLSYLPPGFWYYFGIASSFWPAWMAANYMYNVSLYHTSVASNTVLSNTSSLWTMLLSAVLLSEKLNPLKFVSVGLTIGGVALVAVSDKGSSGSGSGSHDDWSGDMLALFSAFMYAVYTILLKRKLPESEEEVRMPLVFGCVGLSVFLFCWPILIILHFTGIEPFEWPKRHILGYMALNALIGTNLSDVLWAKAVVLTSPLVATVGLSLSMPLAMISDAVLRGKTFSPQYVLGSGLVLLGFCLVNTSDILWGILKENICAPERLHTTTIFESAIPKEDPEGSTEHGDDRVAGECAALISDSSPGPPPGLSPTRRGSR
eukprot:Hpha_TRINITY_DN210_c0_g1::TRINITY_DN210_c0_g1_i1::g.83578::m.83578/K15289/SLC35F5; solute carrier family 35, member F5